MTPVLSLVAIAIFGMAAATDWRSRRIPNGLVLALAAVALARIGTSAFETGAVPTGDVLVAVLVFGIGALAFHFDMLGGGDVKLMAAGALWTGAPFAGQFLTATLLAGGVLALGYLGRGYVSSLRTGERRPVSLPYGIAIGIGGVLATRAMLAAPDGVVTAQLALSPLN